MFFFYPNQLQPISRLHIAARDLKCSNRSASVMRERLQNTEISLEKKHKIFADHPVVWFYFNESFSVFQNSCFQIQVKDRRHTYTYMNIYNM